MKYTKNNGYRSKPNKKYDMKKFKKTYSHVKKKINRVRPMRGGQRA